MFCSILNAQQQPAFSASSAIVPRLVNFSGQAADAEGKIIPGIAGATFAIYKDQFEGSPLWLETQNIQGDAKGNYTVQLGATKPEGLPLDLFSSGEARWLGVSINGGSEQPRILLLSVPYALKAADAETIGGLPPSAFMLATSQAATLPIANSQVNGHTVTGASQNSHATSTAAPPASNVTTGGGKVNTVPLFTTSTNIQNSLLTQTGTTAINVGGKLNLPATGTATSSAGKDSRAETMVASSFNSSTNAAVNQTFQLQAEPAGNNTATPSGTVNLLYGSGSTTPSETGLLFTSKGAITASAVGIGTSAPAQALDLGNNNNMVIRVDPGNDTTELDGGYSLVGRGTAGVPNTWWTLTAAVGGGFGVPVNSYSIWQYPPNSIPGCCLNRLTILPAEASTDTGGTMIIDQNGNIDQTRASGGAVKALLHFSPNNGGRIISCFNSTLTGAAATTPPCGFAYDITGVGDYIFDFGFEVDDRFYSATSGTQTIGTTHVAYLATACGNQDGQCPHTGSLTNNQVEVAVFESSTESFQDSKVHLIIY